MTQDVKQSVLTELAIDGFRRHEYDGIDRMG